MTISAVPAQGSDGKRNLLKTILGFLFGWLPFGKKDVDDDTEDENDGTPEQGSNGKVNLLNTILGFLFGWLPFWKKDADDDTEADQDKTPLQGSFVDRIRNLIPDFGDWGETLWGLITKPFRWVGNKLHREKSQTAKSSAVKSSLKTRVSGSLVAVTRNRWVFWGGFWTLSIVILFIGREKGIIAYLGENYESQWAVIVGPFMSYGEFVAFAIGYLFAMPMDVIPGKGKFSEFIGDAIVAFTFFFLFRLSYPLFWAAEVFIQNKENVSSMQHQLIVALMDTVRYNAVLWVISMVLILAILRIKKWREERNSKAPKKANPRNKK